MWRVLFLVPRSWSLWTMQVKILFFWRKWKWIFFKWGKNSWNWNCIICSKLCKILGKVLEVQFKILHIFTLFVVPNTWRANVIHSVSFYKQRNKLPTSCLKFSLVKVKIAYRWLLIKGNWMYVKKKFFLKMCYYTTFAPITTSQIEYTHLRKHST